MGKAEERRLADKDRGHAAWLSEQETAEGMTQIQARARPNDDPNDIIANKARPPAVQINRQCRGNELVPPSEHGNRCTPRIEPQKTGKYLTSITGIFLLRPALFDELCMWYRTVLHEFLSLAFVSVRLPCYDVELVAVDVWRYDAV